MPNATSDKPKKEPAKADDVWQEQAQANLENWKRTAAELENLKKRSEIEREQYLKFATRGLILDLLPVVDNFDRAIQHVPTEQQESDWLLGITYIHKQLLEVLQSNGVEVVDIKAGDPFDEQTMHATSSEPSDQPAHTVIAVMNRAYKMNNEIIRPASVTVSAGMESNN